MLKDDLKKIGFSPTEIKVYLYLLKNVNSYANKISQDTNINRTNVYDALHRLISKGIVSYIVKNKIKWFEIKDERSIYEYINEKQNEYNNIKKDLETNIKEFKQKNSTNNKQLEASIYVGKKGLKQLFEEMLCENKNISLITSQYQFKSIFGAYFENWHNKRIKKGILQRSIFPISYKNKIENKKLLKIKYIDNKYTNPTSTFIYNDTCLFIQWGDEITTIKIKDKKFAKSYLNHFNLLWNNI
jgi:sugar-specific transcriptional regulator TrmB